MYISFGNENKALNNQGNNWNWIRGVKCENQLVSLVVTGKLNSSVVWWTNIQKEHAEFLVSEECVSVVRGLEL